MTGFDPALAIQRFWEIAGEWGPEAWAKIDSVYVWDRVEAADRAAMAAIALTGCDQWAVWSATKGPHESPSILGLDAVGAWFAARHAALALAGFPLLDERTEWNRAAYDALLAAVRVVEPSLGK